MSIQPPARDVDEEARSRAEAKARERAAREEESRREQERKLKEKEDKKKKKEPAKPVAKATPFDFEKVGNQKQWQISSVKASRLFFTLDCSRRNL